MGPLFGGSSAKTDRGNQLAATQGTWNVFNYGLPEGQKSQATGTTDLDTAKATLGDSENYWRKLLVGGRSDVAARSAPSVNAVQDQADARRRAGSLFGTGRTGGTAAANREAGTASGKQVDDIINANLVGGQMAGAQGLERSAAQRSSIASEELSDSLRLLGLSEDAISSILRNSTESRQSSQQIHDKEAEGYGQAIAQVALAFAGL